MMIDFRESISIHRILEKIQQTYKHHLDSRRGEAIRFGYAILDTPPVDRLESTNL